MPRKVFVAGEILTASDVNTNLMDQAVMVFDDATDRATAIPTPVEGMVTFLKDTDRLDKFDGTDFVGVALDATTSVAGVVLGSTVGSNTALGSQAFQSNTTGASNTAVGLVALQNNTEGTNNTGAGRAALQNNTEGGNNTALGAFAMQQNTTGSDNDGHGQAALQNNTTGIRNAGVGRLALTNNTTGDQNVGVGRGAGQITTTGSNNASLGVFSAPSSATASNEVTLGNTGITTLRCNVTTISSLSDVRDKTDIVDTQHGLDTLNKIRPVDFTWARRDGSFGSAPDIGFIAQELASVEDETGDAHRLRLTLRNNPEKLEATPGRLIPILVKAVQELSAKNDELEARLVKLEGK